MILRLSRLGIALSLLALPWAANAHRSFLVPSSTVLSGNTPWVTVDAARGNDLFYFNHNAMPVDGLVISAPDGSTVQPAKLERFRYRTVFDWQLTHPGTWRAAVVDEGLRVRWEENGQPKRWNGPRERFAEAVPAGAAKLSVSDVSSRVETFVTSGTPTAPPRIGRGMEFVYEPHPTDLVEGESTTLTVLVDGQPAADLEVEVLLGAERYRNGVHKLAVKTDGSGRASFAWPAPGLYWLHASKPRAKVAPPATRGSVSYVATVEVLPR